MKPKDNAELFIVLVQGIVKKDDKYLFGKRSAKEIQSGGEWGVPGGKVDIPENKYEEDIIINTLRREIIEEVGIEVEDNPILFHNNSFERSDGIQVVGLNFLCKYKSGDAKPLEDTDEVQWLTLDEAREIGAKYMIRIIDKLEDFLSNKSVD